MQAVKSMIFVISGLVSTLADARDVTPESTATKVGATLTHRDIWKKSSSHFSGDLFLLPQRGNFLLDDKGFDPKSWDHSTLKGKRTPPHAITMHGFAWDYDLQIPIVFFDPKNKWTAPGQFPASATQQDIAPTLSHILGIPGPARVPGRILTEALQPSLRSAPPNDRPRVIVVFVQDQAGRQYFAAHPQVAPYYESLIKKGANFVNAAVSHVDVETSVGHVAVGTGAWPPEHGVSGNDFFHTGLWRQIKAFNIPTTAAKKDNLIGNPSFLFAPTFADLWLTATDGKAKVFSQVYAPRAAIGMGGHGALFKHGKRTHVVWMDERDNRGETFTTDPKIYELPTSHAKSSVKPYVLALTKNNGGSWLGHKLIKSNGDLDSDTVKTSPAQSHWEGDLAVAAVKELKIGEDDVTDLVFINTKATDACGHRYGFESDECREVLAASDTAAKKIVDEVSRQSGGSYLVVLTADHGAAPMPEFAGALRYSRDTLVKDINKAFDRRNNNLDVVLSLTSSQLYLNRGELAANGHTPKDVAAYLKAYKVPFAHPYNAQAAEWIKKGVPKESLFFQDVATKEEL